MATAQAIKTNNSKTEPAIEETRDDLAAQIAALKADLSSLTARIAGLGETGARALRTETKTATAKAAATGEALIHELAARERELELRARAGIREHPLQAVAIAAGVGFLAALLVRR
ncbi:DUF883 family protein [Polymorphum gilvum]|uniref:DUF883 domain-containing protein n=1 Tax=Polymorphum gilvum (strain LMG 25793 / CGMCC 1.9160 / SL003B-26A1) TaxID=991905 RepID=F2IV26_POLGS|nr:DUF883 family protein [Polymorphum gilvum]ADZ71357.1 hypothetical protein SL003B_2934 [Polymorphum gilvum SL003B-26A1]